MGVSSVPEAEPLVGQLSLHIIALAASFKKNPATQEAEELVAVQLEDGRLNDLRVNSASAFSGGCSCHMSG
jgi:hypothetical protein